MLKKGMFPSFQKFALVFIGHFWTSTDDRSTDQVPSLKVNKDEYK